MQALADSVVIPQAAPPSAQLPPNLISSLEAGIFKYTNQHRASIGVPLLTENLRADNAARWYSQEMARTSHFDHTMADETSFSTRIDRFQVCDGGCPYSSENINKLSYSYEADNTPNLSALLDALKTDVQIDQIAKSTVDGWIASPGHRRNMEDPFMDEIGDGVAISESGILFATQDFFKLTPLTSQQNKIEDDSVDQANAEEEKLLGNPPPQ